jgi:hypothetical protein
MAQYQITYGASYNEEETDVIEANTHDEAETIAYQAAMELFESYGIFSNQRGDEEFESDEEYNAAYMEEAESWINYSAELIA